MKDQYLEMTLLRQYNDCSEGMISTWCKNFHFVILVRSSVYGNRMKLLSCSPCLPVVVKLKLICDINFTSLRMELRNVWFKK